MNAVLDVQGLRKRFGARVALEGIDLELAPGSTTVILGANGAGKSTLLRCVLGLLAPDAGHVRVLGQDPVRQAGAVRGRIGYVPDQPDAYPWMTARELFRFLRRQYAGWSDERALGLAERLGAPLETRFASMSRGEAAKAMLAAALAPAPPLVVLDEPCARLAPPAREEMLAALLELAPFEGGAALVATHDLDVAARIADRVLVLDGGRLVAERGIEGWADAEGLAGAIPDALRKLYPERRSLQGVR